MYTGINAFNVTLAMAISPISATKRSASVTPDIGALCVVSRAGLYADVVDIAGIPGLASAIITSRPAHALGARLWRGGLRYACFEACH